MQTTYGVAPICVTWRVRQPACPAGCGRDVTRPLQGGHRVALRLVMIQLSCQR